MNQATLKNEAIKEVAHKLARQAEQYDNEFARQVEAGDKRQADFYRGKRDGVDQARREILKALSARNLEDIAS